MILDDLRLDPPVHIPYGVEVFDKLSISPFEFFLAGSRYMGCAKPESDWDFLAQNDAHIRTHLERLGFTPLFVEYPIEAGNTVEVYQLDGEHRVQVQLQRDVQVQRTVRDIIKQYMLEEHIKMGREERTGVWNMLWYALTTKAVVTIGVEPDDIFG